MKDLQRGPAVSGMIWKSLEQYGVLFIQFVVQIVLARIISPEAYGVIAIVSIFIGLANVFVQKGFSIALVQKKEIDEKDLSTVFYFSLLIAAVIYAIIFFTAPAIAIFFHSEQLVPLLRVISITLFTGAFSSIQNAILQRNIHYKEVFIASVVSIGVSGLVAIYFANKGYGVWALAIQQVLFSILNAITLFLYVRWKPLIVFSVNSLKSVYSFGWKVLAVGLLDELFGQLRTLVIGRKYDSASLSFYSRGRQLPNLLMQSTNGALQSVLLPLMSSVQDSYQQVGQLIKRSLTVSTFVLYPVLIWFAITAPSVVSLLLTDKWLPCVVFVQLHCLYYAAWPLATPNQQALYSLGKSGAIVKIEMVRKPLDVIVLFLSASHGLVPIAIGAVAVEWISLPAYVYMSSKETKYGFFSQIKDVLPIVVASLLAGLGMYLIGKLSCAPLLKLSMQSVIGVLVYWALARLFKIEALDYLKEKIRSILRF